MLLTVIISDGSDDCSWKRDEIGRQQVSQWGCVYLSHSYSLRSLTRLAAIYEYALKQQRVRELTLDTRAVEKDPPSPDLDLQSDTHLSFEFLRSHEIMGYYILGDVHHEICTLPLIV